MDGISFREQNRRRRERNAFENLYAYARHNKIPDPKRTVERAVRQMHGQGADPGDATRDATGGADGARTDGDAAERKTPHRLDERTRDELYERAQELDIEGRSKMTKDELVDAIRASR